MNLLATAWRFSRELPIFLPVALIALEAYLALLIWRSMGERAESRRGDARLAFCTVLGFGILDWVLLAALPALGLSFGPLAPAFSGLAGLRGLVLIVVLLTFPAWQKLPSRLPPAGRTDAPGHGSRLVPGITDSNQSMSTFRSKASASLAILWLLNSGILACTVDGLYIEPFNLQTTHLVVTSSASAPGILKASIVPGQESPPIFSNTPLRIVHLSDIHVERITHRERELIERVNQLQPDLILMTGDYLNIDYAHDPQTQKDGRAVLSQLSAPYGVYAIPGSPPVDTPDALQAVFDGLKITLLQDEVRPLEIKKQKIYLVGVSLRRGRQDSETMRSLMETIPQEAYTILLYHTPDLAEAAARTGIDLYLAGHTHGGQIRLPWYGALVTSSAYGKRFEAGLYHIDQTSLYVSRGIGMEGLRLPRARFLCPPEIIVIDIGYPSEAGSLSLSKVP